MSKNVTVEVIEEFIGKVEEHHYHIGDTFETTEERSNQLTGENDYGRAFVKVVKVIEVAEQIEKLTVPQIKEKLDKAGISYDKKAPKDKLLELLQEAEA
ncbi:HeH/LEM domain [Streptococcus equi subsp. equi]|uniref:HeH/LEM domain-containing protein n=1 Tax=Streptococcus equi TaxID=1336 RepID=UPI000658910F|nr:HeH/LEM domain-containing protein [Streptococcus equi]QBX15448.1 hypothetical protein Javan187_0012 [Streptococcus phage Javan187]UFR17993.1 hypothetical protein KV238_07860 [Streptococcus equi subsp. zooepidemicus]UFR18261.1 hypothetical protein KV238_09305 [Streptococcus equi subsp. zooepidemicus]CRQ98334.1 HeH/LEM domain [Streptococcus equi subsp. equi]CRR03778.1 HeH/LEM domain [Streptococcus equi subsp. equi]